MCPLVDGQAVSAEVTNPVFLDKTEDDTTIGDIILSKPSGSGTTGQRAQRQINAINSFGGTPVNSAPTVLPSWTANYVGTSGDNLFNRANSLTLLFNGTTGHSHNGIDGQGPKLGPTAISGNQLRGDFVQGVDLTGVTGGSTNVTTQLTGQTPSSGVTSEGVVVTAPPNKVFIRNSANDDEYVDGSGNVVYGRVTFSSGTWTLSYFTEVTGTETPYSFSGSNGVRWYYQKLFNPLTDMPVYNPLAFIPSDNATADVIVATTALYGKVLLSSTAAQSVGSSNTAGTGNGTVANADHAHQGVHSVTANSGTQIFGDVSFNSGTNIAVSQSSQNISFNITGQVAIANGGTGQSTASAAFNALSPMTTLGDTIYGGSSPAGAGTRLAGNTTTTRQFLSQTGTGSVSAAPIWAQVSGSDLTGVVAIANGGTGQTTASAAFGALSPLTTKGDILGFSTVNVRVPVGSDTQVLTADSTQASGVKWAAPTTSGGTLQTKYNVIFGSAAQVTAGTATNSTFSSWTQAANDCVLILKTYTESANWTLNQPGIDVEGCGHGSVITGSFTFNANNCTTQNFLITNGLTLNAGKTGCVSLRSTRLSSGTTITDNGTLNSDGTNPNSLEAEIES